MSWNRKSLEEYLRFSLGLKPCRIFRFISGGIIAELMKSSALTTYISKAEEGVSRMIDLFRLGLIAKFEGGVLPSIFFPTGCRNVCQRCLVGEHIFPQGAPALVHAAWVGEGVAFEKL
jgi:hypothetical protein